MNEVPNGDVSLDFFSWAVMSAGGWSFLEVEGVALALVSAVVGLGGWPAVEGWLGGTSWPAGEVGSGWLGLAAGAAGL